MAEAGVVIVDKPGGMTSHDVVGRVRRLAGTRRVGHAGTLDPMATGVLVIGLEKATRLLGHLALTEKEYTATIRLGLATVTDDAEGEALPPPADGGAAAGKITQAQLRTALAAFTGEIRQVPPRVSAIKVGGERAYRLTRSGVTPELAARTVTISRLDLLDCKAAGDGLLDAEVSVTCSSGTYIRAIARDLGAALGTGGHLFKLRRTRVGPYRIEAARTLDELAENFELTPLDQAAAAAFPTVSLPEDQAKLVSHGARLPASVLDAAAPPGNSAAGLAASATEGARSRGNGPVAAFGPDGGLLALLEVRAGELRPLAVFVP